MNDNEPLNVEIAIPSSKKKIKTAMIPRDYPPMNLDAEISVFHMMYVIINSEVNGLIEDGQPFYLSRDYQMIQGSEPDVEKEWVIKDERTIKFFIDDERKGTLILTYAPNHLKKIK